MDMTESLKITNYTIEDITVINVQGEIDLDSIHILRAAFDEFLKSGARKLIVDLSGTEYMDSTGLEAFIRLQRNLKKDGCIMCIVVPPQKKPIFWILEVTRVNAILNIYESLEEAVNAMDCIALKHQLPAPEY